MLLTCTSYADQRYDLQLLGLLLPFSKRSSRFDHQLDGDSSHQGAEQDDAYCLDSGPPL